MKIEIGAGNGAYGHAFLDADSSISEKDKRTWESFSPCHVTHWIGYQEIESTFPGASFDEYHMCNPFHYGFRNSRESASLMEQVVRTMSAKASVVVIASPSNPHGSHNSIASNLEKIRERFKDRNVEFEVELQELTSAERALVYLDVKAQPIAIQPTQKTIIHVRKIL